MLNSCVVNNKTDIDISSGTGIYKTHPLSFIVDYLDIMLDTETLDYCWMIWKRSSDDGYVWRHRPPLKKIPIVVLQVVTINGSAMAEVIKKEDYNNETFELKRNIN